MQLANFNKKEVRVKSFTRKGKVVRSYKRKVDKVEKKNNNLIKQIGIAATVLALPVASYLILRKRYRNGISDSANWAKQAANKVNVPELSEAALKRNNINFTVGGLWYNPETRLSTELASYVGKKFKGHTIAVNTNSFNTLAKEMPSNPLTVAYDMKTTGIKNALLKGYNPTSRELAAEMYAYHKKYPTHTMISYGHSSGGTITNETMLILEKMGADMTKFKNVSYGANHYGILPEARNSLNIVDVNDWQANPFKFKNAVNIGTKKAKTSKTFGEKLIEDHGAYHYISNKEAIEKVKQFIEPPPEWKPPIVEKIKTETKKQISKISEDTVTEEVRLVREMRQKLRSAKQSYSKAESNTSIPENKKKQALDGAKKKIANAQNEYEIKKRKLKQKIEKIRSNR